MTVRMNDRYATALRDALVDYAGSAPARSPRRVRRLAWAAVACLVFLVGAASGAVAAAVLLPGSPDIAALASSTTAAGEGTQTIELGVAPQGATDVEINLTCLTSGTFLTADGASLVCDAAAAGSGAMAWHLAVAPGMHSTTISAGPGERWRLTATYARVSDTAWGVNADGLTFGVANGRGTPDLVAAIATNGRAGYVYSRDLFVPTPTSLQVGGHSGTGRSVRVYASDGRTVVGELTIGLPASAAP